METYSVSLASNNQASAQTLVAVLPTPRAQLGRPKSRRVTVPADAVPWERIPGETAEAYRIFAVHRDTGHRRSYERTAQLTGKTHQAVRHLSSRNGWAARIQAYRDATVSDAEQIQRERTAEALNRIQDEYDEMAPLNHAEAMRRVPGMSDRDWVAWSSARDKVRLQAIGITERGAGSGGQTNVQVINNPPADPNSADVSALAMAILSWAAGEPELSGAARQRLAAALGQGSVIAGQLA